MRISKPWFHVQKIIYPSWHFNIAMEHGPLQDDLQHSYGTWPTSRWFTYWKWWCAIDSCPGIFSEETIPCYFCHTIRPEQGGSSRNLKQMSSDSKLDLIGGISPKKKSKASMSQDIVWTSNMSKHKTHIDTHRHTYMNIYIYMDTYEKSNHHPKSTIILFRSRYI